MEDCPLRSALWSGARVRSRGSRFEVPGWCELGLKEAQGGLKDAQGEPRLKEAQRRLSEVMPETEG